MIRDVVGAGLLFGAGAAGGWWFAAPAPVVPTGTPSSGVHAAPLRAERCRPETGAPDAELERRREVLGLQNRVKRGSLDLDFGPPMVAPDARFDPDRVRATLERTLTLGTLHFSSCDEYPCAGLWDVRGEDLEAADQQLDALRALYPDATTSWWQDAGPNVARRPPGQVPFIIHGPIDWEVSADQNGLNEVGRIRWESRALKAELLYRLGPDAEEFGTDDPNAVQPGIPRPLP